MSKKLAWEGNDANDDPRGKERAELGQERQDGQARGLRCWHSPGNNTPGRQDRHGRPSFLVRRTLSPEAVAVFVALAWWIGLWFQRYRDWHSVDRLEKGLDRDELERETGQRLAKAEL